MNYKIITNKNRLIVNKKKKYFKSIALKDTDTAVETARLLHLVLNDIENDLGLEDRVKKICEGIKALVGNTLKNDIKPLFLRSTTTINKQPATNQDIINFFKGLSNV